jgi:hypothetical protein
LARARDFAVQSIAWAVWFSMTSYQIVYIRQYSRHMPLRDDFHMVPVMTGSVPANLERSGQSAPLASWLAGDTAWGWWSGSAARRHVPYRRPGVPCWPAQSSSRCISMAINGLPTNRLRDRPGPRPSGLSDS